MSPPLQITDLYCPRPSRGFAFVQFVEAKVAKSLLEKDHMINGVSVHIGAAKPKGGRNDGGASGAGGGRYGTAYGDRDGGHYGGDRDGGHHGSFGSWQRQHPFDRPTERQYDPFRDRWM